MVGEEGLRPPPKQHLPLDFQIINVFSYHVSQFELDLCYIQDKVVFCVVTPYLYNQPTLYG